MSHEQKGFVVSGTCLFNPHEKLNVCLIHMRNYIKSISSHFKLDERQRRANSFIFLILHVGTKPFFRQEPKR